MTKRGIWLIVLASFLSLGAWWDFGKPKKEKTQEVTAKASPSPVNQSTPSPSPLPLLGGEGKREGEPENVEQIQTELKQIINRTNQLQASTQANRSDVLKILERAQIHERILRTMTYPAAQPVPIRQIVNMDDVVRREKIRLIAEQAKKTQDQLRVLEQTRAITSSQSQTTQGSS